MEDADYPALARFSSTDVKPDELARRAARALAADPTFRRAIAETAGEVIGTGMLFANRSGVVQAGRYWFTSGVAAGHPGVGSRLLGVLTQDLEKTAEIGVCLREDTLPQHGYLAEWGFEERFRSWGAHLDLEKFEPRRFDGLIATLESAGVSLVPYPELPHVDKEERLSELKREIDRDAVSFEPIVPSDSEDILGENYLRDGLIVAVDSSGNFLGLASLRRESDGEIGIGLTGVRREQRGRGIATALKVRSLQVARELGASSVGIGGAAGNPAIKHINQKLGFEVGPEWVTLIARRQREPASVVIHV